MNLQTNLTCRNCEFLNQTMCLNVFFVLKIPFCCFC